ncbi:hypothetical protein JCM11641_000558 [Rhodosporidiobolus odoratus]
MLRSAGTSAARALLHQSPRPTSATVRSVTRLTRRRKTPSSPSTAQQRPLPPSGSIEPPTNIGTGPRTNAHDPPTSSAASTALISPISQIPVHIPHDPLGVLDRAEGSWAPKLKDLLSVPALAVVRQIEMMNVFLGYEEANKYQLLAPDGRLMGYLLEEKTGFAGSIRRQVMRTHRPFRATVLSPEGEVLLRAHRPFALINSRIYVSTPTRSGSTAKEAKEEMKQLEDPSSSSSKSASTALTTTQQQGLVPQDEGDIIGEVQQEWHLYRRRYNLFVKRGDGEDFDQFARSDGGFLSWDFEAKDEAGQVLGSVSRNFAGFARELFTDTGHYVLSFEAASADLASLPPPSSPSLPSPSSPPPALSTDPVSYSLTPSSTSSPSSHPTSSDSTTSSPVSLPLDHRATLLASAITIDIDFFSRSRGGVFGGAGFMPLPIPMGGTGGGGGAAGDAGEAGAGTIGTGNAHEGPLPPTEMEGGTGGLRTSEEGVPRGEDGVVPRQGAGQGWGEDEGLMEDPWAIPEQQEEGGTWGWGDLFDGDDGGGGDGW